MKIFQIIILPLIHQIIFALPDLKNRPKKDCVNKFEIELRAVLVRCTKNFPYIPETTTRACDLNKKPRPTSELKCLKKISVTLKVTNQGETTTTNQYIIIDHVKDGKTNEKVFLLNPYVIVIRQESILQLYGLKFVAAVNGQASKKYKRNRAKKMRQARMADYPENLEQEYIYPNIKPNEEIVFDLPQRHRYTRDSNEYVRKYRYEKNAPHKKIYNVTPKIYRNTDLKRSNLTLDRKTYAAENYQWYSAYELSQPVLQHTVYVKVFEKREKSGVGTDWFDLTAGPAIETGSLNQKYLNKEHTLLVRFYNRGPGFQRIVYNLDPGTKMLLIKRPGREDEGDPANENPSEYLLVNKKDINFSPEECDSADADVQNKAFFTLGTDLQYQPNELWRRDKRANKRFDDGGICYLSDYARLPENVLRKTDDKTRYLALYMDEKLKNAIDIDIAIDDNHFYQGQARSQITEVYVDGTGESVTIIIIKLFNNGLISNSFHPKLTDCPLELPVDWSNLEGDPVLIPPQHHAIFTMRLFGTISVLDFFCTVEAMNDKNEVLAMRRIRIIKEDRCICGWHCRCACLKKTGLGCRLMSLTHYKAAGFIGSMPLQTTMVQKDSLDKALFSVYHILLLLTFVLLLMGLAKALIGLLYVPIGIWGLDILIGLRPLYYYYEKHLRSRQVVYDCDAWPVHPDTFQRTVRITPKFVEFFLNLLFFFTYPFMLILILSIKLCCPYNVDDRPSNVMCRPTDEVQKYGLSDSEDINQFEFDESNTECDNCFR